MKKISLLLLFCFFNLVAMEQKDPSEKIVQEMVDEIFNNVINAKINHNFLCAARDGKLKKIKKLIEAGVNINIKDDSGKTALILASERGHVLVLAALIDAGANRYIRDKAGYTAAYYAFNTSNKKAFDLVF